MDITLDLDSFKALASESRVSMLKTLAKRRMTASELAQESGLRVQTVSEHLERLETAGLVARNDEGRKWVYYSLTDKGRAVASPQTVPGKVWVLLSVSVLALLFGGFRLFSSLAAQPVLYQAASESGALAAAAPRPGTMAGTVEPVRSAAASFVPPVNALDVALIVIGALLLGYALSRLLRK